MATIARCLARQTNLATAASGLAVDIEENEEHYVIRADLPGVSLDDISVNIHDDLLTISAETATESDTKTRRVLVRERRVGKFRRSLRFPVPVNVMR